MSRSKGRRRRYAFKWYRYSMRCLALGGITGPGSIDAWNHYAMFPYGKNPKNWRYR